MCWSRKKKCQKSPKTRLESLKIHSKITQNHSKSPKITPKSLKITQNHSNCSIFQLWLPLPPGSDTGAQRHWLGRAPRTRAGKRGNWRPFDGVLRRKTAESGEITYKNTKITYKNMRITYKNTKITYKTGGFTYKT
jgi:hypothetical protein